mgnify:CR=1 FL=1
MREREKERLTWMETQCKNIDLIMLVSTLHIENLQYI